MAKRNYNKISTKHAVENETPVTPAVPEADAKIEEPEVKPTSIGIVVKCGKLNIRKRPTVESDAICEAPIKSELMIDIEESTDDWFKVCTAAGSEGFCMKQFVEVQQ